MISILISSIYAICLSVRYQFALKISLKEYKRYIAKSLNLALCYNGFSPNGNLKSSVGAGEAAFYSCAYDVVTDWRRFNADDFIAFKRVISRLNFSLRQIILDLYALEQTKGGLKYDGLERGVMALESVSKCMGIENYIRSNTDFGELGIVMQIVDDVLDLEEDRALGEMNCLLSSHKKRYLDQLIRYDVINFEKVFPRAYVLSKVLAMGQKKALGLCGN